MKLKRTAKGLALFTIESIPANQQIIEYVGPIINSKERSAIGGKFLFEIDNHQTVDGRARSNKARYISHSCAPNSFARIISNRIWIWSKKTIKPGEEITIHYGKKYFEAYIKPIGCKCQKCLQALQN